MCAQPRVLPGVVQRRGADAPSQSDRGWTMLGRLADGTLMT